MVKESNLEKGISAIIPTYKGEAFISKLLDSLINQSIDPKLFEAIFHSFIIILVKKSTSQVFTNIVVVLILHQYIVYSFSIK